MLHVVLCRVPEECGVRRTLPLCEHVDGQDLLPGRLRHHGDIRKWMSDGGSLQLELTF